MPLSNAYFSLAISEIISQFQSLVVPFAYCPLSTSYFHLSSLKSSANFQSAVIPFAYCLLAHTSPFSNNSTFLLKKNFKFVC